MEEIGDVVKQIKKENRMASENIGKINKIVKKLTKNTEIRKELILK